MYQIEDIKNTILQGDALIELKKIPSESIDSIVTSPPYFNLRDYGVKGQIGLESTWQEYIGKLIDIFAEVKRVLKKDGTCFVNLGDSYNSKSFNKKRQENILEKSLLLIPERFAISMVDNGWILRNKLIWIKPNAMPESVQDRWKKAHEYIFFFVKNKKYQFDLDAIRTTHKEVSIKRAKYEQGRNALGLNPSSMGKKYLDNKRYMGMPARMVKLNEKGACPPDYFIVNTNCSENDGSDEHYATYPQKLIYPLVRVGCPENGIVLDPFCGTNTTGLVARSIKRNWVGVEINPDYVELAKKRLAQEILL